MGERAGVIKLDLGRRWDLGTHDDAYWWKAWVWWIRPQAQY